VADQEGFREVAAAFRAIAKVEVQHEKRYRKLLENVEKGKVFKKDKPAMWKCRNCGHFHEGTEAPEICPACLHPKAYFELAAENY
jgi:rubrerythrin